MRDALLIAMSFAVGWLISAISIRLRRIDDHLAVIESLLDGEDDPGKTQEWWREGRPWHKGDANS